MLKKQKGFTLIELLSVVAIINIILFIAYPAYQDYIKGSHEDNAKLQMFDIVSDLERIKGKNFSYEAAFDSDDNYILSTENFRYPKNTNEDKRYDIEIKEIKSNEFTIIATPTDIQSDENKRFKIEYNGKEIKGLSDLNGSNEWKERWY